MKKKIIVSILLVFILWQPLLLIAKNQDQFFKRDYHVRYAALKKLYYSSQYVVKKNPAIIPDEAIEAFAAGVFLKGLDPILIVHDHPPLGKYILALSIILFDNESAIIIFLFAATLLGLYLVGYEVTKNKVYSLLPLVLLTNEPLMITRLVYTPNPETVQLPFTIFAIYFFIQMVKGKDVYRWAILTSLSLGCVISIRFFILGSVLLLSQLAFLILKKRFHMLFQFMLTLPLALVVLFLSYTRTVMLSGNIIKPFSTQKYILAYHSSKFTQMFTVWDLLMFNRWHTWWGTKSITSDPNWLITWPISAVLSMVLMVGGILRRIKINDPEWILLLWVLCYGITLSTGYSSVRYFLPWIPFFYILAFSLLYRIKLVRNFFI